MDKKSPVSYSYRGYTLLGRPYYIYHKTAEDTFAILQSVSYEMRYSTSGDYHEMVYFLERACGSQGFMLFGQNFIASNLEIENLGGEYCVASATLTAKGEIADHWIPSETTFPSGHKTYSFLKI